MRALLLSYTGIGLLWVFCLGFSQWRRILRGLIAYREIWTVAHARPEELVNDGDREARLEAARYAHRLLWRVLFLVMLSIVFWWIETLYFAYLSGHPAKAKRFVSFVAWLLDPELVPDPEGAIIGAPMCPHCARDLRCQDMSQIQNVVLIGKLADGSHAPLPFQAIEVGPKHPTKIYCEATLAVQFTPTHFVVKGLNVVSFTRANDTEIKLGETVLKRGEIVKLVLEKA